MRQITALTSRLLLALALAGAASPAGTAGADAATLVAAVPGQFGVVATDGAHAAWAAASDRFDVGNTVRVFVARLADGKAAPVAAPGPDSVNQESPAPGGGLVAWQETTRRGGRDVYVEDLMTGRVTAVAAGPDDERLPQVTDGWVLWSQAGAGTRTLMARDIRSGGQPIRVAEPWGDLAAAQRLEPVMHLRS